MKKIKTFRWYTHGNATLEEVEKEVNTFSASHDTIDIKISSAGLTTGYAIVYMVIYKEG